MGFTTSIIQFLLFFLNFFIAISIRMELSGLVLMGLGFLTNNTSIVEDFANDVSGDTIRVTKLYLITLGGIIFIVSFFGCCGSIQENYCMTTTYSIILLAIFLMEVIIGVFLSMDPNQKENTREFLAIEFSKYYNCTKSQVLVDEIQNEFHCCGIDGPKDWTNMNVTVIPYSCCLKDDDELHDHRRRLGKTMVAIIFALYFANNLNNRKRLK